MLHAELSLMALVTGLYLYDSALVLYCNEAVMLPRGRSRWAVGFGFDTLQLRGRELFIPNPLKPHRPQFRLAWRFEGAVPAPQWQPARGVLWPLSPMIWAMMMAMFVLLPLGLFTRLGDRMLLLALSVLYGNLVIALIWLWFNRSHVALTGRQFAALSFECLTCAPFALNLIRTLSSRMPVEEDLVCAARRLQRKDDWALTLRSLVRRLDHVLEGEEETSQRRALLQEHRRALSEEAA